MKNILAQLKNDEAGFIVSAELILVSTIAVLGLIVGLAEVSHGVNQELEDVGSAVGAVNQSFHYSVGQGAKGQMGGTCFEDYEDECDNQWDVSCDSNQFNER